LISHAAGTACQDHNNENQGYDKQRSFFHYTAPPFWFLHSIALSKQTAFTSAYYMNLLV